MELYFDLIHAIVFYWGPDVILIKLFEAVILSFKYFFHLLLLYYGYNLKYSQQLEMCSRSGHTEEIRYWKIYPWGVKYQLSNCDICDR